MEDNQDITGEERQDNKNNGQDVNESESNVVNEERVFNDDFLNVEGTKNLNNRIKI